MNLLSPISSILFDPIEDERCPSPYRELYTFEMGQKFERLFEAL